jgi:hypothetical protein
LDPYWQLKSLLLSTNSLEKFSIIPSFCNLLMGLKHTNIKNYIMRMGIMYVNLYCSDRERDKDYLLVGLNMTFTVTIFAT